jgi:Homeodomain-like domain
MPRPSSLIHSVIPLACTLFLDVLRFLGLCLRPSPALAAENLFLRTQLALYQEHHVTPRRVTHTTRVALVWLSWWCEWRPALAVVQPETFMRWRRQGFRRFWHGTLSPGRPPIPVELQALIRQMAHENLTWGQRRIANELRLKLGLRVSPRTVRKYLPTHLDRAPGHRVPVQRWRTFVCNHAWDLIVRGVAVDWIRGVHALTVCLIQFLQHWWCHTGATGVQGASQGDAGAIPLLRVTISVPIAWPADTGAVIRVDQRSPPDDEPSCTHDPDFATRATSVDQFDVCPADAALHWWNRATPPTQGARPLSIGGSREVPGRRAA